MNRDPLVANDRKPAPSSLVQKGNVIGLHANGETTGQTRMMLDREIAGARDSSTNWARALSLPTSLLLSSMVFFDKPLSPLPEPCLQASSILHLLSLQQRGKRSYFP